MNPVQQALLKFLEKMHPLADGYDGFELAMWVKDLKAIKAKEKDTPFPNDKKALELLESAEKEIRDLVGTRT